MFPVSRFKFQEYGFTLMELLIYIGIFAGVSVAVVSVLYLTSRTKPALDAKTEVQQNMRLVLDTINQKTSQAVSVKTAQSGLLELIMPNEAVSPTIFTFQNGVLYMKEGTAATTTLTSDKVNVDSLVFGQVFQPPAPRSISVALTMSYKSGGNPLLEFSSTLQQLFPIAQAVTFDSDLLPASDNSYRVGVSGQRWKDAIFSGNVGIAGAGITNPFQVGSDGKLAVTTAGNVGIGIANPNVKLSVTTTGSELWGSAHSLTLRTMAGALGTTAGASTTVASFGFTSSNQSALDIQGYRTANGTDWQTTAILLGMGVDHTPFVNNAYIAIGANGNIGIGTTGPNSKLDVKGNIQISNATIPMGLMTELGGTTPLLNFSVNFREPNKNNTYRGAAFRIDTRDDFPLFQWLTRAASSTSESIPMVLLENGNVGIGTTGPGAKLEIVQTEGNPALRIESGSPADNYWLDIRPWSPASGVIGYAFDIKNSGSTYSNVLVLREGNVGIGTTGTDHKLTLSGDSASYSGPHIKVITSADNYPLFQQLNWTHNNVSLNFDSYYWDGAWRSAYNGSNYQIYKLGDLLRFRYASGIAAGNAISWNDGITLNASGKVGIGTTNAGQRLTVASSSGISIDATGGRITNVGTPTANTDAANKAYVDAAGGGITFMGYTSSTYNGNLGGTKGANDKCNSEYAGSRAMTYDDWLKLGINYPYTYDVWLIDGSYCLYDSTRTMITTRDGYATYFTGQYGCNCLRWTQNTSDFYGSRLFTGGYITMTACNSLLRLACVK